MTAPALSVGIDGFNLAMPDGTGVATYGRTLGAAIKGLGGELQGLFAVGVTRNTPTTLREVLFYESLEPQAPPPRRKGLRGLVQDAMAFGAEAQETPLLGQVESGDFRGRLPAFDRVLAAPDIFERAQRHFTRFGRFMTVRAPDPPPIMHWTYPMPLRMAGARNVYTIHDLVPLKLPHTTLDHKRRHYRLISECLRTADQICTISEATRRDILSMFPWADPDRLHNTYQAVSGLDQTLAMSEAEIRADLKALHGLDYRGYFFFFGAIEPKKNVERILEGYLGSGTDTPLVLVGSNGWMAEGDLRILGHGEGQLGGTGRVLRMDYLPRSMLMRLVRGAKAVIFPSLYEGFGLPALEAMMLGTPVLTSNTSSLPEVVGCAAITVDPYDTGQIRTSMQRLDRDAALRERLSAAGPQQAAKFSMAAYQERLSALYAQALTAPAPDLRRRARAERTRGAA